MGRLHTLRQVAMYLNLKTGIAASVNGVNIDTRILKPGDLFFALKGDRVDGHNFLSEAASKRASAAIVASTYEGPCYGLPILKVEDPLQALQELTKEVLKEQKPRIVAVTGSVGKTTTKEFISTFLRSRYKLASSLGNYNSQAGIPLTILNHTTGAEEVLVLEMGMTLPGHLARLVQIAPPEVAVLTAVTLVHAVNFKGVEEIAWTKSEIFSSPQTRLAILPREVTAYQEIINQYSSNFVSYSTCQTEADYYLNPEKPSLLYAHKESLQRHLPSLQVPGKHNLSNLLAAISVARYFSLSWEEIAALIPALSLIPNRLQFIEHQEMLFLNDAYNACELSTKAALDTLPLAQAPGRKIAVLGSMLELGKFSDESHQRVGEYAVECVDQLYCLGEECLPMHRQFQKAGKPSQLFLERLDLVEHLRKILKPLDVVLLKGSCSKELWKILDEI